MSVGLSGIKWVVIRKKVGCLIASFLKSGKFTVGREFFGN